MKIFMTVMAMILTTSAFAECVVGGKCDTKDLCTALNKDYVFNDKDKKCFNQAASNTGCDKIKDTHVTEGSTGTTSTNPTTAPVQGK